MGLAVNGTNLLVANSTDRISEYNATTGAPINFNFITGPFFYYPYYPGALLLSGSTLYVDGYYGVGTYNANNGSVINAVLINVTGTFGLAISSLSSCLLQDTLSYSSGTLTMKFNLANPGAFVWNTSLSFQGIQEQLFSPQLPSTSVPLTETATISLSSIGTVGVLSTITTTKGIVCSSWQTVNTGP
jgi:hypothetical protein